MRERDDREKERRRGVNSERLWLKHLEIVTDCQDVPIRRKQQLEEDLEQRERNRERKRDGESEGDR